MKETIQILKEIWEHEIKADYEKGLLPNEATLQAAIYHYIMAKSKGQIRVFAAIKRFLRQTDAIPDLILAHPMPSKKGCYEVAVVMELKNKFGGIEFDKKEIPNMVKLGALVKKKKNGTFPDYLEINPWTGDWREEDDRKYLITSKTIWVLAAIGEGGYKALEPDWCRDTIIEYKGDLKTQRFWHFKGVVNQEKKSMVFKAVKL
jgi:hypothetical protein